jgi:hypothetical protein
MIDAAVEQIAKELNQSLRRQLGSASENLAVVSDIVAADGTVAQQAVEKLAVFLVSIQREPGSTRTGSFSGQASARLAVTPAPLNLNLLVMVAANFSGSHYPEALKLLSHALLHFQARPVIDHHSAPELDRRIERLVLEVEDLSVNDLSNLWGVLGGQYRPSVLYRVRMISIDASQLARQVPAVSRPALGVGAAAA